MSPQALGTTLRRAARSLSAGVRAPVVPEALALARIAFGAILFVSLLELVVHAREFFSDEGVLPRTALFGLVRETRLSVLDAVGSPAAATAVAAVAALAALCLCIGWHTRVATVACFILVSGLVERNLLIADGHDTVNRVMLAWFMFVPMGARYSVDAALRQRRGQAPEEVRWTLPVRLAQMQFAWIYLDTFTAKLLGASWREGTAVRLALETSMARPLGVLLRDVEPFVRIATYGTLVFEGAFFLLVFLPFRTTLARRVAILFGIAFHLGIVPLLGVGWFPLTMISLYPLFMDRAWAEGLAKKLGLPRGGPRVDDARALVTTARPIRQRALGVVLCAVGVCVAWSSLPPALNALTHAPAPMAVTHAVESLELWQEWTMFAPNPMSTDLSLVARGKRRDGRDVDVLAGRDGRRLVPTEPGLAYSRWEQWNERIVYADRDTLLEFGRFLCRESNGDSAPNASDVVRFTIVRREVPGAEQGQARTPIETEIWSHECFDPPATTAGEQATALGGVEPSP